MSTLSEVVKVERRFALSARLDSDLNGTPPLTGYILQESVRKSLGTMLSGISDGHQYSYTWTGPYGGGKSCAALLVANIVAGSKKQKKLARTIVGPEVSNEFGSAFPGNNWQVLALTGRRSDFSVALEEAFVETFGPGKHGNSLSALGGRALVDELEAKAKASSGLLVIVDEMGKFLEHAMSEGGDIHILQDIAERAARSNGKLVVIGILHQSFEQYAGRLSRTPRDEWAKIQGRYQNVPFVAQADEVAALIARAIATEARPTNADDLAFRTATAVASRRPLDVPGLTRVLSDCWPLHPITTLLLGPVSRQRFAQNERSVFGFLSSAEPFGFQAHLSSTAVSDTTCTLFGPDRLWDYLVANFGSALAIGADGSRVTLAMEAVERASLRGPLFGRLVKSAAIIELFRSGSGLSVSDDLLALCVPDADEADIAAALAELVNRAILIKQPRIGGYALFAGSDFDLDDAINKVAQKLDAQALSELPNRLGLASVVAKRHYFETGALRTFDLVLQFADDVASDVSGWAAKTASLIAKTKRRATGVLVLLVPDEQTMDANPAETARALSEQLEAGGTIAAVAVAKNVLFLRDHASDLYALERVETSYPQLEGDRIARRALAARKSNVNEAVRRELLDAYASADWWISGEDASQLNGASLTIVASALAGRAFDKSPVIHSELLYRDKPSSSAMAGLRALAYNMIKMAAVENLGMVSYPAERGLYITVLQPAGLHRQDTNGAWRFSDPDDSVVGQKLVPAWNVLASGRKMILSDLYDRWTKRPYGIKRGVMPLLALAFLLGHRTTVAVYVDGRYQAAIDDVFIDRMLQDPSSIEFRRIQRSKRDDIFVEVLAKLLSTKEAPVEAAALPVASALYQRFHDLPLWTQRTATIDANVRKIRDIVLKASDPEALLFSDLSAALDGEIDPAVTVAASLLSAESAYPRMLTDLRSKLAELLGVSVDTFEGIGTRAITASGVTADLRVDAFIMRAGAFGDGTGDIEGLASLLVHKPPRNWSDREQQQAVFEMAKLARQFREAEAFASVKGRAPTSQAISVVVGLSARDVPHFHTFEVTDQELTEADNIATELLGKLREHGAASTVELAALARIVERLSNSKESDKA